MASQVIENITKSASDKREYRGLELTNGIKVLLISDAEADKSAGALSVGVGAMNDPVELPGLAHFCEHMVFLGTGKYPDESGFDKFLSTHGGGSNASTYSDHTVYRFDVSPDNFHEALDRFAQFFIKPLFNESSTEREVNAVNSENDKNIPNDDRRATLIEKALLDQKHPYSKFSTGNYYSLWTRPKEMNINVREELLKFHEAYYSANIMSLTILGKEKLDELQSMAESLFSPVLSKNIELPCWPESPYPESVCQLKINISPVKDLRKLNILFPAPDMTKFYKSANVQYLTHLLGHEGPGSLFSFLKKKNWVNRLSAWSSTCGRGSADFRVQVDLSIEGWEHQHEVVEHIFQYIKLLKASGPQKWIWDEIRDVEEIKFRFKEKSRAETYVNALAQKVHNCPNLKDLLSAGFLITEYRPDLINQVLDGLVPERCRITTMSKANDSSANLVEPWYKSKYFFEKIYPSLIKKWGQCELARELTLPPRNDFIPSVFELKPRDNSTTTPKLVLNNRLVSGWFLQDNEYLLPKGSIFLELFSPLPLTNPLSYALNHMMVELVIDELTEFSYMAGIAGIWYSIKGTEYGVELHFGGYDQKLNPLVMQVLDKMLDFKCDSNRLAVLLERYKRILRNWEDEEPRIHAVFYLSVMFAEKRWTKKELLQIVDEINKENLIEYSKQFISKLKLNCLVYGNFTAQESAQILEQCQTKFEAKGTVPLASDALNRTRDITLPGGSDIVFERDHLVHSNSCTLVYFQSGKQSEHENVLLKLLDQLLSETCFSTLRTKEQLGYIVGTFVKKFHSTVGFAILVQSIFHPEYLESRIDNFLEQEHTFLKNLSDEQFNQYKQALAVVIAEKPKTMDGRATRLWTEVVLEQYNFDRQNIELQVLEKISNAEVLHFFENLVGIAEIGAKGRAGVHIISITEDGAGKSIGQNYPNPIPPTKRIVKKIEDLSEWKKKQEFCEFCAPSMDIPKPTP